MRILIAGLWFAAAALLTGNPAWAADGPPPPPPAAPAPAAAVVPASGCGCCPAADPCRKSHLEIQGHLAMLTPDPEGGIAVDLGGDPARWDPVDYDPEIGGRVSFTFPWSCWDVTIAGTWWGQWEDDATDFGSLTSTQFPGGPPGINPPDTIQLHEAASLWDVNLVFLKPWHCSPCFTSRWGLGVRYLHFDEQADFSFLSIGAAPVLSTISSDVDSDLLAAELVVEGVWKLSGCWDFLARGSAFAGWMRRKGEIELTNAPVTLTGANDDRDDLGYGGELELALRWHPSACWSISVGYGLLALGPVTRGHESMDFENAATNDFGPVFRDDTLLTHRVFLGIGFSF